MRFPVILIAVASSLLLGGCSPDLISLEAAASEHNTIFDPALLGTWGDKPDGDVCVLLRGEGNRYVVIYVSDGTAQTFDGRLFQAGQARVMDLAPRHSDEFHMPAHAFLRILSTGEKLRWAFLDSEWFRQRAAAELESVSREGGKLLLTTPPSEVAAFLARYAADGRAHGGAQEWLRLQ